MVIGGLTAHMLIERTTSLGSQVRAEIEPAGEGLARIVRYERRSALDGARWTREKAYEGQVWRLDQLGVSDEDASTKPADS